MKGNKNSGLYIHIPICRRKCLYCDFYSAGEQLADWDKIAGAILSEALIRREELPSSPSTIYIGGGTPSLLPPDRFERLMAGIRNLFPGRPEEVTIEANPDDVDMEHIEAWRDCGVNRVSIGVQSFRDEELKAAGRRHTSSQAAEALKLLRRYFSNISADLIFGLPGQSMRSWRESVEKMLQLRPDHISAYSLMYEEGTALTALRDSGRIAAIPEEDSERMFIFLTDTLRRAGYHRYEISNYSQPGKESRHNTLYWEGAPYLGLGPSAHSYDGMRTRRWNPADIRGYLCHFGGDGARAPLSAPFYEEEILSDEELREEYLLTKMRMSKGISLKEYAECRGMEMHDRLLKNARRHIDAGYLRISDGRLFLTDAGILRSDPIIVDLAM